MQANAVAVRFVLLECIVLHFECLSKRSSRNFVFRNVLRALESIAHGMYNVWKLREQKSL